MDGKPPEWFWTLLDKARPHLDSLAQELERLPRERLIEYARLYQDASQEVCDYAQGPTVDGIPFSEDDTEDLCDWVVSRGAAYWGRAVELNRQLEPVVRAYWHDRDLPPDERCWSSHVDDPAYRGYQSPRLIAHAVFEARFHEVLLGLLD